jgi:ATP-binding cassette subfamily B protein
MFQFAAPVKMLIFLACLYLALWVGAEVLAVRQTGQVVDQIQRIGLSEIASRGGFWAWVRSGEADAVMLRHFVFVLAGLTGMLCLLRYLREVANAKMSMEMVYYIREAVYDKLQRVGFSFHDHLSTGQLINRALSDLQNVRQFINTAILVTGEIVLIVGGYIVLLFMRSPWVALLALAPLPLWTWYILRFSRKVQPAQKEVMEADDRNISIITENIAGVHVVKAFATEKAEIAKYGECCDAFYTRVLKRIRMFANFTPVIRSIATASHLTLFLAAAVLIIKGKFNAGDILILGAAMGAILSRLQQVATINEQYQAAIVSARRLHEVLSAPPTIGEAPGARPLPEDGVGAVRFEKVTFGYDAKRPVIADVSFEVKGGSVVAIVGPTGAGKTTLVNLIARFYDPQEGRILIDGVDVREVSLDSLRTQVAFVFQETYLFSDTVEANIAYGRPHIKGGEVEAASRLAQAHDFIETLPKGYATMLGERGASLSGGQRQRLAIARAILSNPRVLVLDDATAAIDPETEDLIRRGMRFVLQGRTTFIIAHRISTVKQADVVMVLERGRITQMGTHEQLMEEEGHYRNIAEVQLYGDDIERDEEGDELSHMKRVQNENVVSATAEAAKGRDSGGSEANLG